MTNFHRDVYCILGLPFDKVTIQHTVHKFREASARRSSYFLSTPNLNFAIGCRADAAFRDSVIQSDLVIADGMPLVWVAWVLGIPIRERVSGSSLIESLRLMPGKPLSVYFFGGPAGAAKTANDRLQKESYGLTGAGYDYPGFGSLEEMSKADVIERINDSRADFLIVALGAKKGQAWILRNRKRIKIPLISHLGAVMNFVAGTVKRAPAWLQGVGLEWLWRIKEEPSLWRRYAGDGLAFLMILITRVFPNVLAVRLGKPSADDIAAARIETNLAGSRCEIRLRGAWTSGNIGSLQDCFAATILAEKDICLELEEVHYTDSAFVGLVVLLYGHQRQHGRQLVIAAPSKSVRRVIRYCCAEYLY